MSPLNWCGSSPLRKSHVGIHASQATLMLPMPNGKSLFCHSFDGCVDMLSNLPYQLLVERHGFAYVANIEYEKLIPFRHICQMIGHSVSNYRNRQSSINSTNV